MSDESSEIPEESGRPPSEGPASRPRDTSVLPKATVPVELAPKPADPAAAAAADSADSTDSAEGAAVPEQEEAASAPAQAEPVPPADSGPRGFRAWVRSLNGMEKFCCALIMIGVLAFCAMVFVPSLLDFPEEQELTQPGDFPITGKVVEVRSAETYWREPVTEGPEADTVRPGTLLMPVLSMSLSGKGSIRVLFRNSDGDAVGDPLVHECSGEETWSAACTAGLTGIGDFAAYQAGEIEAWSVELYEIQADDDAGQDSPLFQMNISPIRQ